MIFRAKFNVRGIPKPQGRPRASARMHDGRIMVRAHDSGTAEGWKSLVMAQAAPHRPAEPLAGPLGVSITFYLPRPKSLMRKNDPAGPILHSKKPDADNLGKSILDCLTQDGWWRDDSQVARLDIIKLYHSKNGTPGAEISVEELKPIG